MASSPVKPRPWLQFVMVGGGVGLVILSGGAVYYASIFQPLLKAEMKPTRASEPTHCVGRVTSDEGPIAGAIVRIQGDARGDRTDRDGKFQLVRKSGIPIVLAAWKEGFFIGQEVFEKNPTSIHLRRLPEKDFPDYEWILPTADPSRKEQCGNCHQEIVDEWQTSGHAQSATNRRFLNLYEGTDWHGQAKQGWSLRDEYSLGVGVCAACHAPSIAFEQGASTDMRSVTGTAGQGVHCDFCHKVQDVAVENAGLTHGRYAMSLLRPEKGQLFFGPLDDATRGEETYSPVQKESRFCAACHEGVVFGVHVYSTFSEWQKSPAAAAGKSCQVCHMTPTGKMTNIAPGFGGIERDPQTLASHSFMPGGREAMLKRCLKVEVHMQRHKGQVAVEVRITPHDVGHMVPTGFIDRHLILTVEPQTAGGVRILSSLEDKKTSGADSLEELATLPGRFFGRLLKDERGQKPVPFWRNNTEALDSRLLPEATTTSEFAFPQETRQVHVRLLYRRFWSEVARAKQWPDNTIVVYEKTVSLEQGEGADHEAARPKL